MFSFRFRVPLKYHQTENITPRNSFRGLRGLLLLPQHWTISHGTKHTVSAQLDSGFAPICLRRRGPVSRPVTSLHRSG